MQHEIDLYLSKWYSCNSFEERKLLLQEIELKKILDFKIFWNYIGKEFSLELVESYTRTKSEKV